MVEGCLGGKQSGELLKVQISHPLFPSISIPFSFFIFLFYLSVEMLQDRICQYAHK